MKNKFDIIVIGAGSGGLNIAGFMNNAGFKILLIDKKDENIGGDCLNTGCVPSKALIHIAKTVRSQQEASRFYSQPNNTGDLPDINKITQYIKNKQNHIREHENAEYFRKKGMTVVLGEASFAGKNSVKVNDEIYTAKKIILATGSRPRNLELPGIEKLNTFTNENIFDIDFLPKHLVVIGGGPIGVELGQAFRYLGSEVSILARGFLDKEDSEISEILKSKLENDGIKIYTDTEVKSVDEQGRLLFMDSNDEEQKIETDAVLVSIGRVLNLDNLSLEAAGIEKDERGKLKVDNYLRTTNKNIMAIGDVAGNFMFTHAAELHSSVIIQNFFMPFDFLKKKFNGDKMAWVTYTDPEIATFGLSTNELKKRSIKFETLEKDVAEDDRAIVDDYEVGKLKVHVDKNGKVLGGTLVARNAGELIQELILLNSEDMKIDTLSKKVYPYPTATRINRAVALGYLSRKLSPAAKKIFKILY